MQLIKWNIFEIKSISLHSNKSQFHLRDQNERGRVGGQTSTGRRSPLHRSVCHYAVTPSNHMITPTEPAAVPHRSPLMMTRAGSGLLMMTRAGRCDERLRGGLGAEAKKSPSLSPAPTSWSQIRFARMPLAVTACLKAPQTQTDLWKRLNIASVFLLMFMLPATIRLWGLHFIWRCQLQCNYTFKC